MDIGIYRHRFAWIALAVVWILTPQSLGQSLSIGSARVVADSVNEFSGDQGKNGWFYGYWDRSTDTDSEYSQETDFNLLPHYGVDEKNGLRNHDGFSTGDLWFLEDGRFYTSVWAEGGHAQSALRKADPLTSEHWAVRRWISKVSGVVTIVGHAGKAMPWGKNWGGQCQAIIVVDGKTVFSSVMDEQGLDYTVAVKVREKSVVDFMIAPGPSIGVMKFTASIRTRTPMP
jgi:hypothetical protein